jgi:hypothetical protein
METKTEFLPFNAINEFMRPDFRIKVIRDTLNELPNLPEEYHNLVNRLTKKYVKVPGFRNSDKAPVMVKVLPLVKAFEKTPDIVAAILAAWSEAHSDLRTQVYSLLNVRNWRMLPATQSITPELLTSDLLHNWPVLPIEVDRTKLPGFFVYWPKGEDFDTLYNQYTEMFPESNASMDQVSLMVVWLSLRLPHQIQEDQIETVAPSSELEGQTSEQNND